MKIIVDIVLLSVLLLGFFLGYKRGFVKTVAKPVKLVAVWACSIKFCSAFADRLIAPLIQSTVTEKLSLFLKEKCGDLTASNVSEELPTILKIAAGIFNINVNEIAAGAGDSLTDRLAETFTQPLVSLVSVVISFVLLLLICSVLFSLLLWILNGVFRTHTLSWLNRLLGVLFGAALALIVAWCLSMLFGYILGFKVFSSLNFEGGAIYRFFKTYHPLDLLLGF